MTNCIDQKLIWINRKICDDISTSLSTFATSTLSTSWLGNVRVKSGRALRKRVRFCRQMTVFTPVTEVTWRQKTSPGHATLSLHIPHSTVRLGRGIAADFLSPALGAGSGVVFATEWAAIVQTAFPSVDSCLVLYTKKRRSAAAPILSDTSASSRGRMCPFRNISYYDGAEKMGLRLPPPTAFPESKFSCIRLYVEYLT